MVLRAEAIMLTVQCEQRAREHPQSVLHAETSIFRQVDTCTFRSRYARKVIRIWCSEVDIGREIVAAQMSLLACNMSGIQIDPE